MQKRTGIRALLLVAGVILVSVLGVQVARAAYVDAPYKLNVGLASEEYREDLGDAEINVSLYLVATGEEDPTYVTYNYTFSDKGLQDRFDALQAGTSSESWQDFYDDVAENFDGEAVATGTVGGDALSVDTPGIYLLLVEEDDKGCGAYSELYGYEFLPTMVALPGKLQEEAEYVDGAWSYPEVTTAQSDGEWLSEISIALKASRKPLFGSLQITKNLPTAPTKEPVSFSFTLTDEAHDYVYKGVLLTIPVGSTTASTIVTHIPAGYTVTVTEDTIAMSGYSMTGYEGTVIEIVADEVRTGVVPTATFTNEPTTPPPSGGHGIENLFTWDPNAADGAGDWVWTSEPVQQQNAA